MGAPPLNLTVEVSPSASGVIDGLREVAKGDNLALFARPETGYVFSGWTGSLSSKDNPLFIQNANSDLSLKATFVSVESFLSSPELETFLSGLASDSLREKATLELALFGHSFPELSLCPKAIVFEGQSKASPLEMRQEKG